MCVCVRACGFPFPNIYIFSTPLASAGKICINNMLFVRSVGEMLFDILTWATFFSGKESIWSGFEDFVRDGITSRGAVGRIYSNDLAIGPYFGETLTTLRRSPVWWNFRGQYGRYIVPCTLYIASPAKIPSQTQWINIKVFSYTNLSLEPKQNIKSWTTGERENEKKK